MKTKKDFEGFLPLSEFKDKKKASPKQMALMNTAANNPSGPKRARGKTASKKKK